MSTERGPVVKRGPGDHMAGRAEIQVSVHSPE